MEEHLPENEEAVGSVKRKGKSKILLSECGDTYFAVVDTWGAEAGGSWNLGVQDQLRKLLYPVLWQNERLCVCVVGEAGKMVQQAKEPSA